MVRPERPLNQDCTKRYSIFFNPPAFANSKGQCHPQLDNGFDKVDFVRLLNKRGAFEKEGQRFTCMIKQCKMLLVNYLVLNMKHQRYEM